jgi:tyrosyl-DNA phosphodiesterase 2
MFSLIPTPGKYVSSIQQWQSLSTTERESANIDHFTIATLNVWFADYYFEQRCRATLALLESLQPDVITLQEVTPAFLTEVQRTPWIQASYSLSDIYGDSVDPYGVIILSKLPIHDWEFFPLPGAMGRSLVTARAELNQTSIMFATVHLESQTQSAPTRAKQLARIFPLLGTEHHVILTGDFNFCSTWDENRNLDPTYQDVWSALHQTEPGFTEDTDRNTMRMLYTGKQKQVRFDRILLRSEQPGWQAESIQLIGTESIQPATPNIFPSDHFGLAGKFVWQP